MRILYHHRTLADGAEGVHIAEMVQAFRSLGHDVRVLGLAAGGAATRRGRIARLRDLTPRAAFEAAAVASNAVEYAQVGRAIREFQPDVLYKRHARFDVAALAAARASAVRTLLEVNCLFTGRDYRRFEPMTFDALARLLERKALKMATRVLAVSTPLARQITDFAGVTPLVVPNGADPVHFDPTREDGAAVRRELGLGTSFVVGWTGVLRDWHGLDRLLEAVARIDDAHLLIVGDGPARADLITRAEALGLGRRITVTGRLAHADIPRCLGAMDVAVVADDRTGVASPMKLLEYMAMGRAVVAPRLPNIEDVVVHDRSGWLFEPERPDDLLAALQRLARDPSLRARLGSAARATVVDQRNWRAIATSVLASLPPAATA